MIVHKWSGLAAEHLQAALRMTNEAFAGHLGVAVRTVATWHERPESVPRPEIQQALDSVLAGLNEPSRARFAALYAPGGDAAEASAGQRLRVAISIVIKGQDVLLVCTRTETSSAWQFPGRFVKPESTAEVASVRGTLAETGVTCRVTRNLGSRVHPITDVFCEYLLCEYLAGDAQNLDPSENVDVLWSPIESVTKFIPLTNIFRPVVEALEALHGKPLR